MTLFEFADQHKIRIDISRIPSSVVEEHKIDGEPSCGPWMVSFRDIAFENNRDGWLYISTHDDTQEKAMAEFAKMIRGQVIYTCPMARDVVRNKLEKTKVPEDLV